MRTMIGAIIATGAVVSAGLAQAQPSAPPNIIHIIADDLGYDDVGSYGATDIPTPNIDRLAREGIRFTSFYAPHAICTPTRAAILTGAYAVRVGLPQVLFPDSTAGLHADEITIAELLKTRGYRTALIGKWHLGHHQRFLPTRHGFDRFFGIPYPNDHVPERLLLEGPDKARKSRGFPPMPLIDGEAVVQQPAQLATLPERFTAEAIRFMTEHRAGPFYLQLSNIETHTPWLVAQPFQYKAAAGVYGDAVVSLDWTVGQVLDAIARLGIDDRTLVVFTSDNGPLVHRYPELEGIYGHASTVRTDRRHVLREGKYQASYEGGVRVPCLMRWPRRIAGGTVSDAVVAGFDLYPTFAKLAGAEVPADRVVDGKDITPLMLGVPGARSPHDAFFYYQGWNLMAVRRGRYKLLVNPPPGHPSGGRFVPVLYDLDRDLGETEDLAPRHPEVVSALMADAERARADLGDRATGRRGSGLRAAGSER